MSQVTLRQIRKAVAARDPKVAEMIVSLCETDLPTEDADGKPYREGALTLTHFLRETRTSEFRKKDVEEQQQYRLQQLAAIESTDAEIDCPDRLRVHEVIEELWEGTDVFTRTTLLEVLREVPLEYGPWKAIKKIFKKAEERGDTEVFAAIAVRIDIQASSSVYRSYHGPSLQTLQYMRRRAWRYLRRIGQTFPAIYPDVAIDFLVAYPHLSRWQLQDTWIAAHILAHEGGRFNRNRCLSIPGNKSVQKMRAYPDHWRRSPRPLFSLLERASADLVLEFAIDGLKSDFRASLRDVEPDWVQRLLAVRRSVVDDFVIWVLENVPKFEQSAFRELGLHDGVLGLLESDSQTARNYGYQYAKTYARDIPLPQLIRYAKSSSGLAQELTRQLVLERDARKDIGLPAWGELLDATRAKDWVVEALRKHFGASELTPEWFQQRFYLSGGQRETASFLEAHLLKLYTAKKLGHDYFVALIEDAPVEGNNPSYFALQQIGQLGPQDLDTEVLKRFLLNTRCRGSLLQWVADGDLDPQQLPVDFLKAVAFHPTWQTDTWLQAFQKDPKNEGITYSEELSVDIFNWLSDIRKFSPDQIGFDWLMQLVERSENRYHDYAVDYMIRAFLPADFAVAEDTPAEAPTAEADSTIDLGGQKFLFTGKLATMTRAEAKKKVTDAGGANASGVAKTLDYLVIGDDGSPLYGEGRKGSKQLKAESLRDEGAELKIISETAFLQMLAGEVREFSDDAITAGCERLWSMLVDAKREDDPLSNFARKYLLRHHPEICLKQTDRPVDPGAEVPDGFATFEQFKPLFFDSRKRLRDMALEYAHWEFARWQPPIGGIIDLCESPYTEVREFVARALTADDAPEHKTYRIPHDLLTPDAVYSFCESNDAATRALGMLLIDRNPRLRLPEELFRLTESPDRQVRAFVIRSFWALYRHRDATTGWQPQLATQVTTGKKAKRDAELAAQNLGDGVPQRPENPPAEPAALQALLRRVLYEIPPGPPEKSTGNRLRETLAPLPHRKAKLFLIETIRDLALEDQAFAELVAPVLTEFMQSRGKSEFEACLVAMTRINAKWQVDTNDQEEVVAA